MGKQRDIRQRKTLARLDDVDHRHRVAVARDLIYKKNYAVDSTAVKRLLGKDSLVPTAVRICPLSVITISMFFFSECFFSQARNTRFVQVPYACGGSYARG
jgi:hypothetical protein